MSLFFHCSHPFFSDHQSSIINHSRSVHMIRDHHLLSPESHTDDTRHSTLTHSTHCQLSAVSTQRLLDSKSVTTEFGFTHRQRQHQHIRTNSNNNPRERGIGGTTNIWHCVKSKQEFAHHLLAVHQYLQTL